MTDHVTKIAEKHKHEHEHDPVFSEPIPADLPRRQFDRKLLEGYDADRERVRSMSSRITRIETVFEAIQRDLSKLEQRQSESLAHIEKTAESMSEIAHKLRVHTEMEEYQWVQVNKANDTLEVVTKALSAHIQASGTLEMRVSWLERMLFALYGCAGAIGVALITQWLQVG